jgi:hypothetical protein
MQKTLKYIKKTNRFMHDLTCFSSFFSAASTTLGGFPTSMDSVSGTSDSSRVPATAAAAAAALVAPAAAAAASRSACGPGAASNGPASAMMGRVRPGCRQLNSSAQWFEGKGQARRIWKEPGKRSAVAGKKTGRVLQQQRAGVHSIMLL